MRTKPSFKARPTPHDPDRFRSVKEVNARLAFYGWLFSAAVMIGARGWEAIFSLEALVLVVVGAAVAVHVFGFATFMLQRGAAILIQTLTEAALGRKSAFCARFINGFGIGLFAANLAMVWTGASIASNFLFGPVGA